MYESFFGFTANPFRLSPDAAFFFDSQGHHRARAYLKYGIGEGDGLIVLTGEVGAGKTTLVQAVLQELEPERVAAVHLVSTQLQGRELLQSVALGFDAGASGDRAQLLTAIRLRLTERGRAGARALLIVDEAQNLSAPAMDELRLLADCSDEAGTVPLLQVVLVGQPELRDVLRNPSMRPLYQRITAHHHLGPLNREETDTYIKHRLRNVGWTSDPAFDDAVGLAVYEASRGIPRRINALCNRLLLRAFIRQEHHIRVRDVVQALTELNAEFSAQAPQPSENAPPGVAAPSFLLSAVAERLDGLEKTVQAFLDAVRQWTSARMQRERPF